MNRIKSALLAIILCQWCHWLLKKSNHLGILFKVFSYRSNINLLEYWIAIFMNCRHDLQRPSIASIYGRVSDALTQRHRPLDVFTQDHNAKFALNAHSTQLGIIRQNSGRDVVLRHRFSKGHWPVLVAFADGTFRRGAADPPETHLCVEVGNLRGAHALLTTGGVLSFGIQRAHPQPPISHRTHKSKRQTRSGSYTMTPVKHLIGGLQKH